MSTIQGFAGELGMHDAWQNWSSHESHTSSFANGFEHTLHFQHCGWKKDVLIRTSCPIISACLQPAQNVSFVATSNSFRGLEGTFASCTRPVLKPIEHASQTKRSRWPW